MTDSEISSIKAEFHNRLQRFSYDIGGSLADLAEDVLESVLDDMPVDGGADRK